MRNFWAKERPTSTEHDSETDNSLYPKTKSLSRSRAPRRILLRNTRSTQTDASVDLKSENRRFKLENEALKDEIWYFKICIVFLFICMLCCGYYIIQLEQRYKAVAKEVAANCELVLFLNEMFIF